MAKVANYSAELTATIVSAYTDAGNGVTDADYATRKEIVKNLAKTHQKSEQSIISKLVREKREDGTNVYISAKPANSAVTGKPAMKKDAMVEKLRNVSGLELSASMEKTTVSDLSMLIEVFEQSDAEAEVVDADENDSQDGETDTE